MTIELSKLNRMMIETAESIVNNPKIPKHDLPFILVAELWKTQSEYLVNLRESHSAAMAIELDTFADEIYRWRRDVWNELVGSPRMTTDSDPLGFRHGDETTPSLPDEPDVR